MIKAAFSFLSATLLALSVSTSSAVTIATFADGSQEDVAALSNTGTSLPGITISSLSTVSFGNNLNYQYTEAATGADAPAGSEGEWLTAYLNRVYDTPLYWGSYLTFSISNGSQETLPLTSFDFDALVYGSGGVQVTYKLFYSKDPQGNFSGTSPTVDLSQSLMVPSTSYPYYTPVRPITADLSSVELQPGEKVTFRLAVGTNTDFTWRAYFQNISVNAVPEPSVAWLGLGTASILLRRRR